MSGPIFPEAGDRPVTFNDLNDALDLAAAKSESAGLTHVAAGLSQLTAELIVVASRRHFAEFEEQEAVLDRQLDADFNSLAGDDWAVGIEPGDKIKAKDRDGWLTVTAFNHGPQDIVWVGTTPIFVSDVVEVYTRAEQATNDALVMIDNYDDNAWQSVRQATGLAFIGNRDPELPSDDIAFLTAEAAAALGPWTKVDRPIKVGCWVLSGTEVGFVAGDQETGQGRDWWPVKFSEPGYPLWTPPDKLTLLAREDPAYPCDAEPAGECAALIGAGTYGCPDVYGPPPKCVLPAGHDGLHMRDVSDPSGDQPADATGVEESPKDTQRPWTSLPLITAGDGRRFSQPETQHAGSPWTRRWLLLDGSLAGTWHTDDEISELGEVREAVVVTLPDRSPDVEVLTEVDWQRDPVEFSEPFILGSKITIKIKGDRQMTPQEMVAELLAAARASESGAS